MRNPVLAFYALLLSLLVFYGVGLIVSAGTSWARGVAPITMLLQIKVIFLSGIIHPFNLMPPALKTASLIIRPPAGSIYSGRRPQARL